MTDDEPETKKDEHGTYHPDAGSPHPLEKGEDVNYEPCNAVLKYTFERYGERRYCAGMAVGNFGDAATYDEPRFCKHHQARAAMSRQHEENFKTGAYAKNRLQTFQYLDPHQQVLANDFYKSLVDESTYDFDTEDTELEVDVEDSDFAPDADVLVLDHPVPSDHKARCKALWHCALDFVTMDAIREEQFRVAAEEEFEGRSLSVGETTTIVTVMDDGREIEDTEEHHLNIALSRIQKDYKRNLEFGGVKYESEDEGMGLTREWVPIYEPEDVQPEARDEDAQSPMVEIDVPDPSDSDQDTDKTGSASREVPEPEEADDGD